MNIKGSEKSVKIRILIEWGENYNMLKKSINTNITINGNCLEIKSEENERFTPKEKRRKHIRASYSKPFKPFFLGEKRIDIEDIISVKIKNGRIFGVFTIFCYLLYIIEIFAMFYEMYSRQIETGVNFIGLIPTIVIISYLTFMCFDVVECYKYKTLQINIKNEKSISIPIEEWEKNDNAILKNLIYNLINVNSKIKVKESIIRIVIKKI